jgi:hypothetical protein
MRLHAIARPWQQSPSRCYEPRNKSASIGALYPFRPFGPLQCIELPYSAIPQAWPS